MKRIRKTFKRRYFRKVIIYFLTWCLVLNTSLPAALAVVPPASDALPSGGSVPTGFGNVGEFDYSITGELHVRDVAEKTVINWDNFDIGSAALTQFHQLGVDPAVLNRITSGEATGIFGSLQANGRVFIVNPAGIVFGANSTVNVTQLVASTLNITNENFWNGVYEFAGDIEGVDVYERLGVVNNSSDMYAAEGVALIGRKILNTGTISTGAGGFVVMAAGDKVLLGEPGSQILTEMYSVSLPEEGDGEVINDGHISASAGTVVLAAGDVFSSAVELPKASGGVGRIEQNGHIHANGTTGDGGSISLTAADEVVLASGSETTANAATGGDAGLVVVHSKGRTAVEANAQIQATGGHIPEPGFGGFEDVVDATVEISGDYVNLAGVVNASATGDKRGKIVVDALDMTVANGSKPAAPLDNTVYETWVENQSKASTDVELVAHSRDAGNITVARMTDGEIAGGSGDIVLRTKYDTGAITFLAGSGQKPTAIHTTNGGNIYMLAGEGGITTGDIITDVPSYDKVSEPGKIRLLTTNNGNITTGRLSVNGGSYDEISVIASGDLTINGNVQTITNQVPSETQVVGQARTCLISEHGNVDITGQVTVEAHGKYKTTADIHIDAGQDVKINLGGGQIRATAKTSSVGPANASVLIHAGKDIEGPGNILITDNGVNPTNRSNAIYLEAKPGGGGTAYVFYGDDPSLWDEEVGAVYDEDGNLIQGAHAKLEIDENRSTECPECPTPPGLVPPLDPWAFTTHMSSTIEGNVLEGKTGLTIKPGSWSSDTLHGTLTLEEDGSYVYTPDAGFVGQDRFTYRAITDKGVETDLVEVTIVVSNELPIANPGSAEKHMGVTIVEPLNTYDVSDVINDVPYDDDITPNIVEQPLYGTVTFQKDGDTWTYTYTPTKDANGEYHVGSDSFTYSVTDAQSVVGSSGTAKVTIDLKNNPPQPNNDTVTIDQGKSVVIDVLANDYDPDLPEYKDVDVLTVVQDSITVKHGKLILNDDNTFTYIPDPGYVGQDTFTYAVKDGGSGQELGWTTVTIWVNGAMFVPAVPYMQPAPGLQREVIEISGCPALIKWVAAELGTDERNVQIWMANALASARDIQPCDACANLKAAATILQDVEGTRVAALAQVISQYASSTAPPTEEQMASIADAIANDIEGNSQYAAAGEYLDALAKYVGVLTSKMGFSADESVQFATDNYVQKLADGENVGVAAYVAARLAALGGS